MGKERFPGAQRTISVKTIFQPLIDLLPRDAATPWAAGSACSRTQKAEERGG